MNALEFVHLAAQKENAEIDVPMKADWKAVAFKVATIAQMNEQVATQKAAEELDAEKKKTAAAHEVIKQLEAKLAAQAGGE